MVAAWRHIATSRSLPDGSHRDDVIAVAEPAGEFPEAVLATVLKSLYDDDCLKSVATSNEALQLI